MPHRNTLYPTFYLDGFSLNQIQIKVLSESGIGGESMNFSPSMHSDKWQNISKPFNRIQLLDLPDYTHLLCSRQLVNVRTETGVITKKNADMKKSESIEKDALTEMMSPSVSPSAASDAEVKKSVEMALQDFTPKNRIADSVIDEEAVAEPQSIMEVSTITEEPPTIQRRVSSKQRKLSLEEYRNAYLKVPVIIDRKPVFVSCEVRDRLEDYVRKLGGRKMSVSGLLENIARQHLDTYDADFEQWRKL